MFNTFNNTSLPQFSGTPTTQQPTQAQRTSLIAIFEK
jgi:hypothetical protein